MADEMKQQKTAGEKLDDVREKAEEVKQEAADILKEKTQKNIACGKKAMNSATKNAECFVKEKPLLSVGCAFLAGVAIAKILK